MARSVFTLRLPTDERAALEHLSQVEGRPVNQILNDAVRAYLHRQGARERTLTESLEKLRAYRERDPGFGKAIAAVVDAESTQHDPLEGTVTRGSLHHPHPSPLPGATGLASARG